ncbi:MAG: tetratricopeptide repeat protein [Pseudonocardiaceae bacterium]
MTRPIPIVGPTRVDLILEEIRQRLHAHCLRTERPEPHPHRQVVAVLIDASPPWEQRLALLRDVVLPELPILLVLDNAEDNLSAHGTEHQFGDQQLAAFLAAWVTLDRTRLLVTSRHPFPLPHRAHRGLARHHLGPLSEAETRKLIWRLPALDTLTGPQRHRAYTDLGGHPRSLEYLDALLRGGQARFDDVADRLEAAPIQQPPTDPDRDQRIRATNKLITEMRRNDTSAPEAGLTKDMPQQHQRDWEHLQQPPLVTPPDLDETLSTLGLIAPLPCPDPNEGTEHYLVHRWTATALTKHTDAAELIQAHRRAAQLWHWRVAIWPQDRTVAIQHLIEARYHHHHAHDLHNALTTTDQICQQLHTWGAWTWEENLHTDTLTWLPPRSTAAAAAIHQLGRIAQVRGDYTQAEQRYQASLTINEELGNRAGIATSYHQLGVLRTEQGRPVEGIPYTISALATRLELESPEVSTDLFWLVRQQQEIGEEGFAEILRNLLDADSVRNVINAVNNFQNRSDPA